VDILAPVSHLEQTEAAGRTALDVAVEFGHDAVIERLLAAGAVETGAYRFRRGYLLAHAGQFAAALEWLEKSRRYKPLGFPRQHFAHQPAGRSLKRQC